MFVDSRSLQALPAALSSDHIQLTMTWSTLSFATSKMCHILQIGDCRGFVGLVELLWHQVEIKLGVYNVQVIQHSCTHNIF